MKYDISSTVSLVSRIHSLSVDFLRRKLNEMGLPELSSSHGYILFLLSRDEMLTMGEIAKKISKNKSTATVLVRKLEANGLVESFSNKDDARSKFVKLTSKGKEYNDATSAISKNLLQTFYRDFSEDEKQQLLFFLQRISENFD